MDTIQEQPQEAAEAASPLDDRPTVGTSPATFRLASSGAFYRLGEFAFSDGTRLPIGLTPLQVEELAAAFGSLCEYCGRATDTPPHHAPCWFNAGFQKDDAR